MEKIVKKGDKIHVIDEDLSGTVIKVENGRVFIVTDDGFELDFDKNELVVEDKGKSMMKSSSESIQKAILEKESEKRKNKPIPKRQKNVAPPMEVDLHIHKLVKNEKGLNNYDKLNIQLDTAKRQLEFAISKRIQRLVFIHGVGQGVLKAELEYLLKRYDGIKFYEADYQKYGVGATEVYIFQNAKRN